MSGQNRRLGSQPHRVPHPAIWAACAALTILAVAACGSSAAITPTGAAPTPVTFGSGSHKPTLTGAGSTFVAPFFAVAFGKYHQQHPGVSIGYAVVGSGSVAATVYRTPFSIGYIEQAYSRGLLLPFAAIRNQAGNYVTPSTRTVAAAAAEKPHITPADFSIVNQPGTSSYPISGYSWALVYTHQASQATGQKLVSMLDWLTHSGSCWHPGTSLRSSQRPV